MIPFLKAVADLSALKRLGWVYCSGSDHQRFCTSTDNVQYKAFCVRGRTFWIDHDATRPIIEEFAMCQLCPYPLRLRRSIYSGGAAPRAGDEVA